MPKALKRTRTVELGYLAASLTLMRDAAAAQIEAESSARRELESPTDFASTFVFNVRTHLSSVKESWKRVTSCRDDRGLNQHFLRPAAKELGIYHLGFGFHSFRREAVTQIGSVAGVAQAMVAAGRLRADMSYHYTLEDGQAQRDAIQKHQERIIRKAEGGVQ